MDTKAVKELIPVLASLAQEQVQILTRLTDLAIKLTERDPSDPSALSDREREILDAMGDSILSGKQIATLIGIEYSGSLRTDLAVMTRRGLLRRTGSGYQAVASD